MLVPILSCRMVRLTIEYGFCDDSIVGLVTAGYALVSACQYLFSAGFHILFHRLFYSYFSLSFMHQSSLLPMTFNWVMR